MKKLILGIGITTITLCADNFSIQQKVNVIESIPVYKTITTIIPYEECWDEQVLTQTSNTSNGIGKLLGGITGGILGNQVGGGSGKTAATIGGAIIGTVVGDNLSKAQENEIPKYHSVKKCVKKSTSTISEQLIGYNNIAKYKGKKIIKFSDIKLTNIQMEVTISY